MASPSLYTMRDTGKQRTDRQETTLKLQQKTQIIQPNF